MSKHLEKATGIYKPTQKARIMKSRLDRYRNEYGSVTDVAKLNIEALENVCGKGVRELSGRPGFMEYLLDMDQLNDRVQAYAEVAIEKLAAIIETPPESLGQRGGTSVKDVIKCAELMLQLADKFPKGKVVTRFLDKDLNTLDEEETRRELKLLDAKMGDKED